jgi:hypothetical protein
MNSRLIIFDSTSLRVYSREWVHGGHPGLSASAVFTKTLLSFLNYRFPLTDFAQPSLLLLDISFFVCFHTCT